MKGKTVIFDLDGTLIDSAPGVLFSIEKVINNERLQLKHPLDSSLIGPPLKDTLSKITGISEDLILDKITQQFKKEYDTTGFKKSYPYAGISSMLHVLKRNNVEIHIATNKRFIPTIKILNFLGWDNIFTSVYAVDSKNPSYKNKSSMLLGQIENNKIDVKNCYYVGDKKNDAISASICKVKFIKANWGYDDFTDEEEPLIFFNANSPVEITEFLISKNNK